MKIIEIQKKTEQLYTITFEKKTIFGKKTIIRDVFNWYGYIKYANDNSYCKYDDSIKSLIMSLNGYEPLKIN